LKISFNIRFRSSPDIFAGEHRDAARIEVSRVALVLTA
jgi:hypothetical protein